MNYNIYTNSQTFSGKFLFHLIPHLEHPGIFVGKRELKDSLLTLLYRKQPLVSKLITECNEDNHENIFHKVFIIKYCPMRNIMYTILENIYSNNMYSTVCFSVF